LFVTKQNHPFYVRTGGDGLVKVPCSGLLPTIEVLMLFEKVEKKRIITFYFETSSRCRWVYTVPPALAKTAR